MSSSGAKAMVNNLAVSAGTSCLSDGLLKNRLLKDNLMLESFGGDCVVGAFSSLTIDFILNSKILGAITGRFSQAPKQFVLYKYFNNILILFNFFIGLYS